MGDYNPAKETISYFLSHVSKGLDRYIGNYDNILLLGDFNSTMSEKPMKDFCELYNLENLIKTPLAIKMLVTPLLLMSGKITFKIQWR